MLIVRGHNSRFNLNNDYKRTCAIWYIAPFNDKVLLVVDCCLYHFPDNRPLVLRKFIIIFRCEFGISTSDQPHFRILSEFLFARYLRIEHHFILEFYHLFSNAILVSAQKPTIVTIDITHFSNNVPKN